MNERIFYEDMNTSSTPSIEWYHTWGGSGYDFGIGMALDALGNAYVTGYTDSFGAGDDDICMVKFNPAGGVEWNCTWGGSDYEFGYDMALDVSGNVYVVGVRTNFGAGSNDMCLVKFNSTGGLEWNYIWGGSGNSDGWGIAMDSSGNAYVAGGTDSSGAGGLDMCLVKINPAGGVEWNCTWGGSGTDDGYGIALDALGNAYVCGLTESFGTGYYDMCLVKFNPAGGVEWNYTWGGTGWDEGRRIAIDSSGNAYVVGCTNSFGTGGYDMCLVKFNPAGGVEWNYTWGGTGWWDEGWGIAIDSSGNAYVAGYTDSFGAGGRDMCLVKFNPAGGVKLNYIWGGSGDDYGYGIALDALGNAYVAGATDRFGAGDQDMYLVKFIMGTSEDGSQLPDPLLFLILGGIIGGVAGGSGIVAILVLGIVRPRRKRARAVHAN